MAVGAAQMTRGMLPRTRYKVSRRSIHGVLLTLLLAVGLPLFSLRNARKQVASVAVSGGNDPGRNAQLRILGTRMGGGSSSGSSSSSSSVGPYSLMNIRPVRQPPNISAHLVRRIPEMIRAGTYSGERIKVVSWPQWEVGASTAEAMHIDQNGIRESRFLESSKDFLDFDGSVVWLGDPGYGFGWSVWCGKFLELVVAAQANRARLRRTLGLNLPLSWPIYIVDWSDRTNRARCRNVELAVGRDFVFYSKRSIVEQRSWNNATNWVSEGSLMNMSDPKFGGATYRHTPLTVRTDIVQTMELVLQEQHNLTLRDRIERQIHRTIDVAHLWPLRRTGGKGGVESQLRHVVSVFLTNLSMSAGPNLNIFVGTSGLTQHQGRQDVASDYVETLLESKIMVVTQRDMWEDHYRLFEALISGALVMTDRMLSLPDGLQNGTSILEFSSQQELGALIDYYLRHPEERFEIGRQGRLIAMSRHRSWHRMEEIIFGKRLTTCSNAAAPNACPYVVHNDETPDPAPQKPDVVHDDQAES